MTHDLANTSRALYPLGFGAAPNFPGLIIGDRKYTQTTLNLIIIA